MLTDQRRLSVLWLLRLIAALAILLPVFIHGESMPFRWYVVGAGVAGSFAIDIYQTVLNSRLRRAAARAVRSEYRNL